MLFQRNLLDDLLDIQKHFNNLFTPSEESEKNSCLPYCNVKDEEDKVVVKAPITGINPEEVDITYDKGSLYIKGIKKPDIEENVDYLRRERRFGDFNRVVNIDTPVDIDKINAKYKDGILTIELSKAEEAKPKKIAIS